MTHRFAEIAFTPTVRLMQERHGSRAQYARLQENGSPNDTLGPQEAAFLARADGFYLSTVSETGWPYVQHRGGPAGFLKVLSPTRIAFADFRGNVQYVSAGNALHDDRVAMIVMDYANRRRLKLLGHLTFVAVSDADPDLVSAVELPGYRARIERVALIDVVAFDWNCPQHITVRFTEAQLAAATQPLRDRIAELEARMAAMRA
jgi:predicted pyridoxine 5'-phosphate oxidase superfamily flavin-nucleotide-binding protein